MNAAVLSHPFQLLSSDYCITSSTNGGFKPRRCFCTRIRQMHVRASLFLFCIPNVQTTSFGITITFLDIIHRPVFYLKLNSSLYVCPYLKGKTLRFCYESNRLMLSIGLWRCYVNITSTFFDIIYRPVCPRVSETRICLRLQEETAQMGPIERASLCLCPETSSVYVPHIMPETKFYTHIELQRRLYSFCIL
jgi:hypothetical protein